MEDPGDIDSDPLTICHTDSDLNTPEWHNLPSNCWKVSNSTLLHTSVKQHSTTSTIHQLTQLILSTHLPPRHYILYRLVSKSWKQSIDNLGLHTGSITLHPAAIDPALLDTLPPAMLEAHTAQVTCVDNPEHMQRILSIVQQMPRLRNLTFNALRAIPSLDISSQLRLPTVTSLTLQAQWCEGCTMVCS